MLPRASLYALTLSCIVFFKTLTAVKATALTTAIAANERLCFYADVDKAGEKLGVSVIVSYVLVD